MSNNLNSRKPSTAVVKILLVEAVPAAKSGMAKNVTACPANSSATTSLGSVLPVAAITAGANFTQTTTPAKARAAITIDVDIADALKWHITAKIIVGGSEPQVPGATGSRPRPKHDVSNLFMITES